MIEDLLGIATALVAREPAKPKQTSLRRAVSTAYYAVFHSISERSAKTLIGFAGQGSDWDTYALVYRTLDHANTKRVFQQSQGLIVHGSSLARIGEVFIKLQESRITADYDPRPFPITKSAARILIAEAREVVDLVNALPRDQARKLAAHLLAKRR